MGELRRMRTHACRAVIGSRVAAGLAVAALAAAPTPARAQTAGQTPVDSALLAFIGAIRAIDNHAHPMRAVLPGMGPDTEFDALPLDGLPPVPLPAMMRADSPVWPEAWRALYGYRYRDVDSAHVAELSSARREAMRTRGAAFPRWVLDQTGIDVMLANRVAMGPGLEPPRFRWVAFVDALLFPLDTRGEALTPDTRVLYPLESRLLKRYMREVGAATLPPTLDAYVRTVVAPTLERMRRGGAVAVKFEAAYLRPLDFAPASAARARTVYARYAGGGVPARADYRLLEDYVFHSIARQAGRLGMSVHIHTIAGFGSFYSMRGSDPYNLEATFDDPDLRGTTFVIIHGGWPLTQHTAALLNKPNVYADMSAMTSMLPPAALAAVLRPWLETYPEKVLFGTDAYETGPDGGWEDVAWVSATTARRALAMALTAMMADGEVDRAGAERIARMVLRENAARLYGI
jgi:uncharacterized protein